MSQSYHWKGEPIPDIRAWARARGERIVRIRITPAPRPDLLTGKIIQYEPYEMEMPESFWDNYRNDGDASMREIERFE